MFNVVYDPVSVWLYLWLRAKYIEKAQESEGYMCKGHMYDITHSVVIHSISKVHRHAFIPIEVSTCSCIGWKTNFSLVFLLPVSMLSTIK